MTKIYPPHIKTKMWPEEGIQYFSLNSETTKKKKMTSQLTTPRPSTPGPSDPIFFMNAFLNLNIHLQEIFSYAYILLWDMNTTSYKKYFSNPST